MNNTQNPLLPRSPHAVGTVTSSVFCVMRTGIPSLHTSSSPTPEPRALAPGGTSDAPLSSERSCAREGEEMSDSGRVTSAVKQCHLSHQVRGGGTFASWSPNLRIHGQHLPPRGGTGPPVLFTVN